MAIQLSKQEIDNIKKYRYSTSGATYMDGVFDPFWNWCVSVLPPTVSPNKITCAGIIFPVIAFIWLLLHDYTMTAVLPASVLFLSGFGIFWYQTLDAIDGKQARKTDNCSPLGQLLDHNLD